MLSQQPQPELQWLAVAPRRQPRDAATSQLNPGQALHDRDHLPPGVLLINQGGMRLLGPRSTQRSLHPAAFWQRRDRRRRTAAARHQWVKPHGSHRRGRLIAAGRTFFSTPRSPSRASEQFCSLNPWELFGQPQPAGKIPAIPQPKNCCSGRKKPVSSVIKPVHLLSSGRSHELGLSDG